MPPKQSRNSWFRHFGHADQDRVSQRSSQNIHARCMGNRKVLAMKHIFREVKTLAEKQLAERQNKEITLQKVIITIPFQFAEWHKQQMKDACTLAGFTSSHFIYEPVAATLAFGLGKKLWNEKRAVVFGFGGNSVRVTIVGVGSFVKIIRCVRS